MGLRLSRSRSCLRRASRALIVAAIGIGAAGPAAAHGFGQRYDLPLPLSLYLIGAGAAVALSFVIFGLFMRRPPVVDDGTGAGRRFVPASGPLAKAAVLALKLVTLVLFALVVAAGIWGDQNPYRNIAPTLIWVVWWVGFAYVSALLGNLWALINPWRTVFEAAEGAYRRLGGGKLALDLPYPRALGMWPACALLLAFSWVELVYPNSAVPAGIACLIIAYSVLTFAGMLLFGRDTWLEHGEVFSVVFGLFARFALIETSTQGVRLRRFGSGLLEARPVTVSMTALVLLLLATVLYDGFLTSPQWTELEDALDRLLPWLGANGPVVVRLSAGRVLAVVPRHLRCDQLADERGCRPPVRAVGALRKLHSVHADPDRHRLSRGALPDVSAAAGPVSCRCCPIRSVWLEPVRHRGLSRRHRLGRRARFLVYGGHRDRARPCRGGLSRPSQGHAGDRRASRRVTLAFRSPR